MEQAKPTQKASAPYGRACINCVKSKCRCMVRDGGICERCHRLGKECRTSSSTRTRSAKRAPSTSRRSQLEDKLEDLMTLLRTQQTTSARQEVPTILTPSSSNLSPQYTGDQPDDIILTDAELSLFRDLHLPQFPFVYLPSSLTAQRLQFEKPLFCIALKTICNKARVQQGKLSEKLRGLVGSKMLVDGDKSIDLLLSILTCMIWAVYFTQGKQFIVMFSGLARSLVSDLRFEKAPLCSWTPGSAPKSEDKVNRSNEIRRTLLAVFAFSTIVSTIFKVDSVMPWSSQLEEDYISISAAEETPGDQIIIAIIDICKFTSRIPDLHRHLAENPENAQNVAFRMGPLVNLLGRLRSNLSGHQLEHKTIFAYFCSAEVATYELATIQTQATQSQSNTPFDYKRTEYLLLLLQTCQECCNVFLNLDMIIYTSPCGLMFSYSLKLLYQLLTLQDPNWDVALVRQSVDLVDLLERCAKASDRANATLKEEIGEDTVFAFAAKSIREMIPKWKVAPPDDQLAGTSSLTGWPSEEFDIPPDGLMDFSDEFWGHAPFNF